ncbi:MAG TPA: methyltransferase domain-containing protein [Actinomycetota bacterium]|nr:methyltransferase domain-containing protein [Actinomycetota bacterium]
MEALPQGGSVLDVGCGGGAASIPLSSRAGLLIGVDESSEMLESFAAAALENHVPHREIHGRWPDIAEKVPAADVVLCHHVFYNVPDLTRFVTALDSHARRRVVVELTAAHPNVPLAPLWRRFHKLERPAGPTVEDAVEVLREAALSPRVETWRRPPRVRDPQERAQTVAFIRRRLCLSWEFDEEIDRLLGSIEEVMPRDVATLWWDASPRNNASK